MLGNKGGHGNIKSHTKNKVNSDANNPNNYNDNIDTSIFFVDKDFNFMNVLHQTFPTSTILLCAVHMDRYFTDKVVVTSRSYWPNSGVYITSDEKIRF